MITIKEIKGNKIPGITSLAIYSEYCQELVDFIKTLDVSYWNKKESYWELPTSCLSDIVNILTYVDDITIETMCEEQLPNKKRLISYKTSPYEYQKEGIDYGLVHSKWLLLDSPGLGKSLQIIYLAEELHKQENIKHCLIVCGINTLKSNWKKEISRHSQLDCRIIGERINSKGNITYSSVNERVKELSSPIDEFFIITNIETLRNDDIIEVINNGINKFDMIVVDEIHKCKSSAAIQGHNLLKLDAKYMVGMTGSMIMNSPLDSYVPLTFIKQNHSSLTNFKKYFCNFGGINGYQITSFKNMNILKDIINSCSLRRTKDLLSLPPKNIIDEYIDMSQEHKKFYDDVKNGVKNDAMKVELKTSNLLSLVTRLRQATACPSILIDKNIISSKLERAFDLSEQLLSQNEKVIIFSTFKESVYQLSSMLGAYNPLIVTGDMKEEDVNRNITKFQKEDGKLLIATWQKLGTGVTLNSSSYMIFIDTPWTQAEYLQAQDRIYRIGTKKPVFIYNLICKDTIDERVSELVNDKEALSDYIIDNKYSDQTINSLRKYIEEL